MFVSAEEAAAVRFRAHEAVDDFRAGAQVRAEDQADALVWEEEQAAEAALRDRVEREERDEFEELNVEIDEDEAERRLWAGRYVGSFAPAEEEQ